MKKKIIKNPIREGTNKPGGNKAGPTTPKPNITPRHRPIKRSAK